LPVDDRRRRALLPRLLVVAGLLATMSHTGATPTLEQLIERHRAIEPQRCERRALLRTLSSAPSGRRDPARAEAFRERLDALDREIHAVEDTLARDAAALPPEARRLFDAHRARGDACEEHLPPVTDPTRSPG
jgi:hypothetical protein